MVDLNDLLEDDKPEVKVIGIQSSAYEVHKRLQTDYEFFAEFFLPHALDLDIPGFHHQTWDLMTDPQYARVIEAIPREHAKTTQAKLAVVHHFMFSDRRFCVYLSNTNTIAVNASKDIFALFQTENFEATYGKIRINTASEGKSLWDFEVPLRDGTWKRCLLRGMGANQQMRGINIDNQRPDIAVVDDVEDLENTDSEPLQKKLDRWIFATFIKALTKDHKIIWIGNMLRKTTLLARLCHDPAHKAKWKSLVLGALIRDPITGKLTSLWPELWTVDALKADFEEYQAIGQGESWFCEMMNMPGQGDAGFKPDDMFYAQVGNPEDYIATFITVDPAFGFSRRNDDTAIAVHGIPHTGPIQTIVYASGKMAETDIFTKCLDLTRYWRCFTWGIESVAAQKVLITLFEMLLLQHREYRVVLEKLIPDTMETKSGRITAYVNLMKAKEYALPLGDLEATTQFMAYDLSMRDQDDDLVDCIAYAPQMILKHRAAIIANAAQAKEDETGSHIMAIAAKYGKDIASV